MDTIGTPKPRYESPELRAKQRAREIGRTTFAARTVGTGWESSAYLTDSDDTLPPELLDLMRSGEQDS